MTSSNILRSAFTLKYNYADPLSRLRATALLYITGALFAVWVFWITFQAGLWLFTGVAFNAATLPLLIALPIVLITMMNLLESGQITLAAWIFILLMFGVSITGGINRVDQSSIMTIFLPLVAAGLLQGRRGTFVVLVTMIPVLIARALAQSQLTLPIQDIPAESAVVDFVSVTVVFIVVTIFIYFLSGNTQAVLQDTVQEIDRYRTISQFAAQTELSDESRVIAGLLRLVREGFGYDFAQLYLADESGQLLKRANLSMGTAGEVTLVDVEVSSSALMQVSTNRQPEVISMNDDNERRSHLLPFMVNGVLVPILDGERTIAVLDVQDNDQTFPESDVTALTVLAQQSASLLHSARNFEALRSALNEQESAASNLRQILNETERSQRVGRGSGWDTLMSGVDDQVLGYDLNVNQLVPMRDLSPDLVPAMRKGEILVDEKDDQRRLLVPIKMRNRVLGAMSFELSGDQPVSNRQIELAQNVVNRLSIALENKQLLQQSQAQANRERKASEIAGTLISATDVDTVLNLAANRFNEALGAIQTQIHIQPLDVTSEVNENPLKLDEEVSS